MLSLSQNDLHLHKRSLKPFDIKSKTIKGHF